MFLVRNRFLFSGLGNFPALCRRREGEINSFYYFFRVRGETKKKNRTKRVQNLTNKKRGVGDEQFREMHTARNSGHRSSDLRRSELGRVSSTGEKVVKV